MQTMMNRTQQARVPKAANNVHAAPLVAPVVGRKGLMVRAQATAAHHAPPKVELHSKEPAVDKCVNAIRFLAIDGVNKAKSGHPGMPMGCAPMGYVLWNEVMRYNPKNPQWFNRDRFVLSAGHGSMFQYAMMHLVGYDAVTVGLLGAKSCRNVSDCLALISSRTVRVWLVPHIAAYGLLLGVGGPYPMIWGCFAFCSWTT